MLVSDNTSTDYASPPTGYCISTNVVLSDVSGEWVAYVGPQEEPAAIPFTPPPIPKLTTTLVSPEPEIGTGDYKTNTRSPCPRPRQLAGSYG